MVTVVSLTMSSIRTAIKSGIKQGGKLEFKKALRNIVSTLSCLMTGVLCMSSSCRAADVGAVLEDAKLYVTAPVRWDRNDWLYAGGAVLAVAAAHHYDDSVRQHFAGSAPPDRQDTHSTKDALPAAIAVAGTWALAWVLDDSAGYRETRNMLEAGAFSVITTVVLKQVAGRERPNVTADNNALFKHGSSFPSLHVSAAMAIGTVLAESGGDDYRWVRRGLGYGLGMATAYVRLQHQQHWFSDTVAGAALGMATARFVLNRNHPDAAQSSLLLLPAEGGVMLSYAAAFH